jgi:hypothetical protein
MVRKGGFELEPLCGRERGAAERESAGEIPSASEGPLLLKLKLETGNSLVRKGGFEPPRVAPPDPKSGASASSATLAFAFSIIYRLPL